MSQFETPARPSRDQQDLLYKGDYCHEIPYRALSYIVNKKVAGFVPLYLTFGTDYRYVETSSQYLCVRVTSGYDGLTYSVHPASCPETSEPSGRESGCSCLSTLAPNL
jgi:hypothetical protein